MNYTNRYRKNTRRWYECDALIRHGLSATLAYNELEAKVNNTRPFFFKDREGETWQPTEVARDRLRFEINQVRKELLLQGSAGSPEAPVTPQPTEETATVEEEPEVVDPLAGLSSTDPLRRLRLLRQDLADYCNDSLSMRSVLNAAKMIKVGLPLEAVVYALTVDQKPEMRRQLGVADFDVMTYGEAPESGYHRAMPYLAKLVEANVPIFLKGLAGFGKSYMAEQLATYMGRDYRETPVSPGAMRSDLFGKDTLKQFVESGLAKMYESGGFFCFEEIDAAPPGILISINNMIANEKFDNPNAGRVIERHADFRALATGNTWGGGATADFAGRERQDGATLDRFRAGRVEIPLDPELESDLFHAILKDGE